MICKSHPLSAKHIAEGICSICLVIELDNELNVLKEEREELIKYLMKLPCQPTEVLVGLLQQVKWQIERYQDLLKKVTIFMDRVDGTIANTLGLLEMSKTSLKRLINTVGTAHDS